MTGKARTAHDGSWIIRVFQNFLSAVQEALEDFGIHAPLVVVRSDAGEGIVVDIGGTTSDIAIIKNRNVELSLLIM